MKKLPNIKSCPCCGKANIYHGPASAFSMGVGCLRELDGCGLEMSVDCSETWKQAPLGKGRSIIAKQLALRLAIERWNKRNNN